MRLWCEAGGAHPHIEQISYTVCDCLRELGQRIERDHGPTCVATSQKLQKDTADASTKRPADETAVSLNTNDVLMLHRRLKMIHQRAAEANKAALESEKERDELHNQIEQIEEQLHPKRAHTHIASGDAHEILAEVENWDLRDHRHIGVWGTLLWQSISSWR